MAPEVSCRGSFAKATCCCSGGDRGSALRVPGGYRSRRRQTRDVELDASARYHHPSLGAGRVGGENPRSMPRGFRHHTVAQAQWQAATSRGLIY